jgi:histidinol-phosphate aminotransferase
MEAPAAPPCAPAGRPSIRRDLAALVDYHSAQIDVPVRLNTNESPWPPPAEFAVRLAEAVASIDYRRYPDRSAGALRAAIATQHGVSPTQVFVANGSNEVLQTLLLTYAGPGRTVATFEPTYQLHGHIARLTGATTVEGERSSDFTLDLGNVADVIDRHRPDVTFLCSPNNPTGTVDPAATVADVVAMGPGLLVVDEAYGQFAQRSALSEFEEQRALVVTRTFSKTWSMAATRLGYCIAPSWLVAELDKVVLPYHLDSLKQIAGLLAVEYVDEMEARVKAIVEERTRLCAMLAALDVDQWPSGANFVLIRPRGRPGRAVWQALVERGVLIRDCSGWPRLADCLRVTIGTPSEDDVLLVALSEALTTIAPVRP